MNRETYRLWENHMLACMEDSAHDREHVYRVLYGALDIASHEQNVRLDVLICACLLHDIGRKAQFENPKLCHAAVGAEMAEAFLSGHGFDPDFTRRVCHCIRAHRYRGKDECESIEAKILFDADKLDVTGALGMARSLIYSGQVGEPMYTRDSEGRVLDGSGDAPDSFFHEYHFKLKKLYDRFYTARGRALALERQEAARSFYAHLYREANSLSESGGQLLKEALNGSSL